MRIILTLSLLLSAAGLQAHKTFPVNDVGDNRNGKFAFTHASIEVGKDANLLISKGDILDMRTNQLTHAFIQGRSITLESKHTQLYERYKKKYRGK